MEARRHAQALDAAGYLVRYEPPGPALLHDLRRRPPAALVINLSRLPSQGRDLAVAIRHHAATRLVPIVFVDGDPEKVAKIRALIPDAVYTTWSRVRKSLRQAIARPPAHPVAFKSVFGAYAKTPLARKLGIVDARDVALVDAPNGFENLLAPLPRGTSLRRHLRGKPDLTVWFVTTRKQLERRIDTLSRHAVRGGLWIAWPKKGSQRASDLTQSAVRKVGETAGLVDFKVAAFDETWTGLRFTRRQP